ncbi:hypothetical protein [Umezakia ovalisporum]|uniref:hypothetical protein n=1 Tax=Umezakia ovalisporum TaxID=75695 RepID=UPI0028CBBC65|nr:hypothetical protein [Umezakia ovalisporum]
MWGHHDKDANAAQNLRSEGIRILKAYGSAVSAVGGEVKLKMGRKSHLRHFPVGREALTIASAQLEQFTYSSTALWPSN